MEFRLLGTIEVHTRGRPLKLGRRRERLLLGLLLLSPGRVVSSERLTGLLWDDDPPASAAASLRTHVSRLRSRLAPADGVRLVTRDGGYLVEAPHTAVDAHRFLGLAAGARTAADPAERARLNRAALTLWRGPLLADAASDRVRDLVGAELNEARMACLEQLIDAELELAGHARAVPEVTALVAEHPLHERFTTQLMIALYRSGRQVEALEAYTRLRDRLAGELGLDPSPRVEDLHTAILRHDPDLSPPVSADVHPPRQLPAALPAFAGRRPELAELDRHLKEGAEGHAVAVTAVLGRAGIGKTALAVQWSHRVADGFPGGQLYLDLRGSEPAPVDAGDALDGLLRALGVTPELIPPGLDARAALYRTRLADNRVLVVLDDARDSAQVRPLLPGAAGCMAVVTSRNALTGLVAEGARPLRLDVLAAAEARELLAQRLGSGRLAAEPAAVDAIVARSGRLPLALAETAALAATRPDDPLAAFAGDSPLSGLSRPGSGRRPARAARRGSPRASDRRSRPAPRRARRTSATPSPGRSARRHRRRVRPRARADARTGRSPCRPRAGRSTRSTTRAARSPGTWSRSRGSTGRRRSPRGSGRDR